MLISFSLLNLYTANSREELLQVSLSHASGTKIVYAIVEGFGDNT
jgi:hypothetical protein